MLGILSPFLVICLFLIKFITNFSEKLFEKCDKSVNSLDPDQAQLNVGPDPNLTLGLIWVQTVCKD